MKGNYAIDVNYKLRIVFEINQDPIPRLPDSSVDVDQVYTKICIVGIFGIIIEVRFTDFIQTKGKYNV